MSEDFNASPWKSRTGEQVRRSGTALATNTFDAYIWQRASRRGRRWRLWPWLLSVAVWFCVPEWVELVMTAVSVGTAVTVWLTVGRGRAWWRA
jgi:hypothetical protein